MIEEFVGIITSIDSDFIYINYNGVEFISVKSDFLYEDYKVLDKVIFRPQFDRVYKALLVDKIS